MKKVTALIMSAVMMLCVFSGCNSKNGQDNVKTETTTKAATVPTEKIDTGKVIFSSNAVAVDDEYSYFCKTFGKITDNSDKCGLYKAKLSDPSEQTLISKGVYVQDIFVTDEWIYYPAYAEESDYESLYRVSKDGKEKSIVTDKDYDKIYAKENGIGKFFVDGDYVYLNGFYGDYIYRRSLIDGKYEKLCDITYITTLICIDKYIYFSDGGNLYRMKKDGTDLKKLTDICVSVFTFRLLPDNCLYFLKNDEVIDGIACSQLYKINLDGTGLEKVTEESDYVKCFCSDSDYVYYSTCKFSEDRSKIVYSEIKKLNVNTGEKEEVVKLEDRVVMDMEAVGDYLFYDSDSWRALNMKTMKSEVLVDDSSGLLNKVGDRVFNISSGFTPKSFYEFYFEKGVLKSYCIDKDLAKNITLDPEYRDSQN